MALSQHLDVHRGMFRHGTCEALDALRVRAQVKERGCRSFGCEELNLPQTMVGGPPLSRNLFPTSRGHPEALSCFTQVFTRSHQIVPILHMVFPGLPGRKPSITPTAGSTRVPWVPWPQSLIGF